jgi:hypothetical protein
MHPLSPDTDPAVERLQLAIMARLPAWRKLALIAGMNALLSGLAAGRLKREQATMHDESVWRCLDERRLGTVLARRAALARADRGLAPDGVAYMAADPLPTILAVVAALDRLGVPYFLTGSIASGIYGAYRATADADIVAALGDAQVDDLVRLLGDRFYADAAMMHDAIQHQGSFNVLDLQTGFKVDVFIPQRRAFDRSRFERRLLESLVPSGAESAYVSSVEDVVLAKLEWYRLGGESSDRQWSDIVNMLKVQGSRIDQPYLRRWAPILDVGDLLERALADAGLA